MEEQIIRAVRNLNVSYLLFWAIPIVVVVFGELGLFPLGMLADDVQIRYYIETLAILFTASCVPLALKLFSLILKNRIDRMSITVALKQYVQWSHIRLGMLEAVVLIGLAVYYLTLSNTGGLCALIGLTASFFCMPGEKRLRNELRIDKE